MQAQEPLWPHQLVLLDEQKFFNADNLGVNYRAGQEFQQQVHAYHEALSVFNVLLWGHETVEGYRQARGMGMEYLKHIWQQDDTNVVMQEQMLKAYKYHAKIDLFESNAPAAEDEQQENRAYNRRIVESIGLQDHPPCRTFAPLRLLVQEANAPMQLSTHNAAEVVANLSVVGTLVSITMGLEDANPKMALAGSAAIALNDALPILVGQMYNLGYLVEGSVRENAPQFLNDLWDRVVPHAPGGQCQLLTSMFYVQEGGGLSVANALASASPSDSTYDTWKKWSRLSFMAYAPTVFYRDSIESAALAIIKSSKAGPRANEDKHKQWAPNVASMLSYIPAGSVAVYGAMVSNGVTPKHAWGVLKTIGAAAAGFFAFGSIPVEGGAMQMRSMLDER